MQYGNKVQWLKKTNNNNKALKQNEKLFNIYNFNFTLRTVWINIATKSEHYKTNKNVEV